MSSVTIENTVRLNTLTLPYKRMSSRILSYLQCPVTEFLLWPNRRFSQKPFVCVCSGNIATQAAFTLSWFLHSLLFLAFLLILAAHLPLLWTHTLMRTSSTGRRLRDDPSLPIHIFPRNGLSVGPASSFGFVIGEAPSATRDHPVAPKTTQGHQRPPWASSCPVYVDRC